MRSARRALSGGRALRSRVVMARHGFGAARYNSALSAAAFVARLRTAYGPLATSPTAGTPRSATIRAIPASTGVLRRCHRGGNGGQHPCPAIRRDDYTACTRICTASMVPAQLRDPSLRPGRDFTGGASPHRAASAHAITRRSRAMGKVTRWCSRSTSGRCAVRAASIA